jgi:outer membrane protein assembly factor BamB
VQRAILIILGLAVSLSGCSVQARTRPLPQGDWLTYQRRPDHNAIVARRGFRAQWKFDSGSKINGGLAIAGDTLYLDTFGQQVMALNVQSGKPRWTVPTDNVTMSTPIVYAGLVYIGTGRNGDDSGSHRFAYMSTSNAEVQRPWQRPEGDHILAFDADTGEPRWTYRTIGEDMPSPAISAHTLVFSNGDFHAYGLDPLTGQPRWRTDVGGITTMASATPVGNDVLVSVCGQDDTKDATLLLDTVRGRILWRTYYGNCDSSPTIGDGLAFVSGVDSTHQTFGFGGRANVAALDVHSGKPAWVYREERARPYTSVGSSERAITGVFARNVYYQPLPSYDEIVAFDARSGAVKWKASTVAPVKMSPVVYGGCLFAGDTAGLYYAYDAQTGKLLSTQIFDSPFSTAPPLVLGDTVFLVNGTSIYARPVRIRDAAGRVLCAA